MSWTAQRTTSETIKIVEDISLVCASLGGPVTALLAAAISEGRFRDVVEYTFDYETIETDDAIYARQVQGLVAKQDFLDLGYDQRNTAVEKFIQSEARCADTNARFSKFGSDGVFYPSDVAIVFHYAQQKIANILGDVPALSELMLEFGPGANTSVKGDVACPRAKLSSRLECSTNLVPVLKELLNEVPLLAQQNSCETGVRVSVAAGKVVFVPKDSKTHRPIVVEPILNTLYQKGFGTYMKRRLRDHGVDLYTQVRNQTLALAGSVSGIYSTIDLASASDTIAKELVWALLPVDWAHALDLGRSQDVTLNGKLIRLEKFSSMGNAFTFELESLLFYSLLFGVGRFLGVETEHMPVFGDDIVCPQAVFDKLVEILTFCGFEINLKKSFRDGPFRESCGADWLSGMDIRPFYLKERFSDRVLFSFHNFCVRKGERVLASAILRHIKPHNRVYGPNGYGDGHLIGSWTLRQTRKQIRGGLEVGFFDTFVQLPRKINLSFPGDWILPAYSVYVRSGEQSPTEYDVVRGVKGYRRISVCTLARSVYAPLG